MSESEHMDNFKFHFVGHQIGNLKAALDLATARHNTIAGWTKDEDWLVLYWHGTTTNQGKTKINPFPSEMSAELIAGFIIGWLRENAPSEREPNIDGSVSRGYEISSKITDGWSYESFRVRPIWAMHHK